MVVTDWHDSPRFHVARTEPGDRRTPSGRPVAPGGWRRAVVGLVVGAVTGLAALLARRRGD